VDVYATAPGTLVADKFVGLTGPLSKRVSKGNGSIKLGNGSSGFKLADYSSLHYLGLDTFASLVWQSSTADATLTIKCLRGTYIPVFPYTIAP
jgi:hypothetical protein